MRNYPYELATGWADAVCCNMPCSKCLWYYLTGRNFGICCSLSAMKGSVEDQFWCLWWVFFDKASVSAKSCTFAANHSVAPASCSWRTIKTEFKVLLSCVTKRQLGGRQSNETKFIFQTVACHRHIFLQQQVLSCQTGNAQTSKLRGRMILRFLTQKKRWKVNIISRVVFDRKRRSCPFLVASYLLDPHLQHPGLRWMWRHGCVDLT